MAKGILIARRGAAWAHIAYKRVSESVAVAAALWNAAMLFLVIAACAGSLELVMAAMFILAAASGHRAHVEENNGKK